MGGMNILGSLLLQIVLETGLHALVGGAVGAIQPRADAPVADEHVGELGRLLAEYDLSIYVSDDARLLIEEKLASADDEREAFRKLLERPLGQRIRDGAYEHGDCIQVDELGGELTFE